MNVARGILQRLLPALVVLVTMLAGMALAEEPRYSVSGTVSYGGAKNGRVYISAVSYGDSAYGVSLGSPGQFKINGLPPGDYELQAFIDTTGTGQRHAFDPFGKSGVIHIQDYNISSTTITVRDSEALPPVPPEFVRVLPVSGGAMVEWEPPRNDLGQTSVGSFNVYWSTEPDPGPGKTAGGGERKGIIASDNNFIVLTGLTNGISYYFSVSSTVDDVESAPSPHVKTTINAPVGGNTISGTVSFGNLVPQGGLFLAAEKKEGGMFLAAVTTPVSPQAFTIPAVPDGTYKIYGFLDMNGNNVLDQGDLMIDEDAAPVVTVSGAPVSDLTIALSAVNFHSSLRTRHMQWGDGESYEIELDVEPATKLPVGVRLLTAPTPNTIPAVATPIDIGLNEWGQFRGRFPVKLRPGEGQVYGIRVFYADGTSEDKNLTVTGVVDAFATPVSPVGPATYQAVPTFTWEAPQQAPEKFSYTLWMDGQSPGAYFHWGAEDLLPSGQTSAVYNFNGFAQYGELPNNGRYQWTIGVVDAFGNSALNTATFTYGYGAITGKVTNEAGEPLPNVQVYAADNAGNPVQNSGPVFTSGNGTYTLSLPAGEYKVHFIGAQGGYISEWYDNAAEAPNATPVDVTADTVHEGINAVLSRPDFVVSGNVYKDNEAFLPGVKVMLYAPGAEQPSFVGYTDQNGLYHIGNVPAGEFKIYFDAPAETGCTDTWLTDQAGQPMLIMPSSNSFAINIHLTCNQQEPQGTTVSGRVLSSATNAGVANVTAKLYDLNGNSVTMMYSNTDGFFTLSYVKPGTYNLHFETEKLGGACESEWYKDAATAVNGLQIVVGNTPIQLDNATITCQAVQQGNTFTGTVGNTATGLGQGGVKVSVIDAATRIPTNLDVTTNQDGWYQIPNVPDGSYYLQFSSPGCQTKWLENASTIDGAVAVQIGGGTTLQTGTFISCGNTNPTISLTAKVVTNGQNVPVVGALVQIVGQQNLSTTSSDTGLFTINGIPAGQDFALKITATNFAPTYSSNMNSVQNIDTADRPYTLYTPAQIASMGNTAGKGVIRSRVVLQSDPVNGYVGGAVVKATNIDTKATYPVTYSADGTTLGGTSTYGNGNYVILNVEDNAHVRVEAMKQGLAFAPRLFTVHADSVSQGRLMGAPDASPYIQASDVQFQNVTVGNSDMKVFSITNSGNGPLQISAVQENFGTAFTVKPAPQNGCPQLPATLQPQASCSYVATFDPDFAGTFNGQLIIESNAANKPSLTITLSGTAEDVIVDPPVPFSVNFTFPADTAQGIAINGPIMVGFSEPFDPATVTATTFSLAKPDGTKVTGTIQKRQYETVFIPAAPLAPATAYTASLAAEIASSAGTQLGKVKTWTFVTAPASAKTFVETIQGQGMYGLDSRGDDTNREILAEIIRAGTDGTMSQHYFKFDGQNWSTATWNENTYYLTDSGWTLGTDNASSGTVVTNNDGTITWTNKFDKVPMVITPAEYDLAGELVQNYVDPESLPAQLTENFPDGSRGYGLMMKILADAYRVSVWDDGKGNDQNKVGYKEGETFVPLTTLDAVKAKFAVGTTDYLYIEQFKVQFGQNNEIEVTPNNQMYFSSMAVSPSLVTATPDMKKGTWELKTVKNRQLLVLNFPAEYAAQFDDSDVPFLAEVSGVIKQGHFAKAGTTDFDRGMNFNRTAFEAAFGSLPLAGYTISVTNSKPEGGTVKSSTGGIDCGGVCESTYDAGASVVLTATPVVGWAFEAWTGCPSASTNKCTLKLTDNVEVTASFKKTDTTIPNTTITKGPDKLTGKLEATFTFSATEASTFQCNLDEAGWEPCLEGAAAATTGTKSYGADFLYDGEHTFAVRATDPAGNEDQSPAVFTWTIDTAVPTVDIKDAEGNDPLALSNLKNPSFTVTGDTLVKYVYKLDGGQYTSPRDISAKITLSSLADGDHILYIKGINGAGTYSDELSMEWTVDTTAPVTQLTEKPAALSNLRSPSFFFSSADAVSYECKIDKGVWEECFEEYTPAEELLDGKHTFVVRGIDEAGNTEKPGSAQSFTWTVDATPPVAVIKSKPTKPVTGTSATIVVTGKDVVAYKYFVDGVESDGEIPVKTPLSLTGLSDGIHTVEISGRDAAGNWQEENMPSAQVTVDNEAPVAAAVTGVPATLTNAKKATIYVGGDEDVVAYQYSIDGGAWVGGTKGIAVAKPISLTLKTKGYTLKVIGVDAAGNWQTKETAATYTWTSDVTVPKVVFQKPVSSTVTEGTDVTLGLTTSLPEPNGVEFKCKVDTGTEFACESPFALDAAPGTHTVSVIATDAAGNISKPAAYKWTVKAAQ